MASKNKGSDKFYRNYSYQDVLEAFNFPESEGYSFGLSDVYKKLITQNRFNPWLYRIKNGSRTESETASDLLPDIVSAYQQEKERLMPLVEEMEVAFSDYNIISKTEKEECLDHNELRKKVIFKLLDKQTLIPDDFSHLEPKELVDKIIEVGGLTKFIEKHFSDLAKEDKKFQKRHSEAIAEAIISNIHFDAKKEKKEEKIHKHTKPRHRKRKFTTRKKREIVTHLKAKPSQGRSR